MVYVRKPKTQKFLILTPQKRPKKLTQGCLPKIWIDPYIWQDASNVLITGWEDLALNAGTCSNIVIDPYFWQTPSNIMLSVVYRQLSIESISNAPVILTKH